MVLNIIEINKNVQSVLLSYLRPSKYYYLPKVRHIILKHVGLELSLLWFLWNNSKAVIKTRVYSFK